METIKNELALTQIQAIVTRTQSPLTHKQAVDARDEAIWEELGEITVKQAEDCYLATITNSHTKRNYRTTFRLLDELGILPFRMTLKELSLCNVDNILDRTKEEVPGSENTKQTRAGAVSGLTGWLSRKTQRLIKKAVPCREKERATYKKTNTRVKTKALTKRQLYIFLKTLRKLNSRDFLIACTIVQGAKRVGEVLRAKIGQIDFEKCTITFKQSKSNYIDHVTVIHYSREMMEHLKEYIGERDKDDYIFLNLEGRQLTQRQVYRSFEKASEEAGLIQVIPHMLRVTTVTILFQLEYSADQIIMVTGHISLATVIAYNNTPAHQNITQEIDLTSVKEEEAA